MTTESGTNIPASPKAVLVRPELSATDLMTLNEEIAGLARAGLPLDQGLAALADEMSWGRLRRVTRAVAEDLEAGLTLPQALARQAGRVPHYYAALVTAGVRSGRIAEVLSTLTTHARAMADLRWGLVRAGIYPATTLVVALLLVTGALYGVVPMYEKIFSDWKLRLPWLTEAVIQLSHVPILFVVLPPPLFVVFLFGARFLLRRSAAGRRLWARWFYAIPLLGTLIRSSRLASFTELLAILVEHQVPLPEAFRLAGSASSDPLAEEASTQVVADLNRGLPLGEALRGRRALPELVTWLAGVGQQGGTLGMTLRRVAELYRRQAQLRMALLRSALPPALIIVTAVFLVAVFIFAIFAPLIGLLSGLFGGAGAGGIFNWF